MRVLLLIVPFLCACAVGLPSPRRFGLRWETRGYERLGFDRRGRLASWSHSDWGVRVDDDFFYDRRGRVERKVRRWDASAVPERVCDAYSGNEAHTCAAWGFHAIALVPGGAPAARVDRYTWDARGRAVARETLEFNDRKKKLFRREHVHWEWNRDGRWLVWDDPGQPQRLSSDDDDPELRLLEALSRGERPPPEATP